MTGNRIICLMASAWRMQKNSRTEENIQKMRICNERLSLKSGISNLIIPVKYFKAEQAQEKKKGGHTGKVSLNTEEINNVKVGFRFTGHRMALTIHGASRTSGRRPAPHIGLNKERQIKHLTEKQIKTQIEKR